MEELKKITIDELRQSRTVVPVIIENIGAATKVIFGKIIRPNTKCATPAHRRQSDWVNCEASGLVFYRYTPVVLNVKKITPKSAEVPEPSFKTEGPPPEKKKEGKKGDPLGTTMSQEEFDAANPPININKSAPVEDTDSSEPDETVTEDVETDSSPLDQMADAKKELEGLPERGSEEWNVMTNPQKAQVTKKRKKLEKEINEG